MTRQSQAERLQARNDREPRDGDHVLYWVQQSPRAEDNLTLEYAVQQANDLKKPLLVGFGLMDDYPGANLRHYAFMRVYARGLDRNSKFPEPPP